MLKSSLRKNRRIKPQVVLTLIVTSLSANFLTACGGGDQTATAPTTIPTTEASAAPSATTGADGLKLGALLPATGDLSSIGQNMPVAAKLAVDTINACGGVNGKPVTLVVEDDQTDPTAGASAMTKLAEADKVAGVIGSFASSVSSAAIPIAV